MQNPQLLEDSSQPLRAAAWNIMWSMHHREGHHHPDDNNTLLGCQDNVDFDLLMCLHARLLEGKPMGNIPLFFSKRGRNSKGLHENIVASLGAPIMYP